jgi:serine/threonine protein kinase
VGSEDLLIGRVIATKFAIESVIGSGAMGVVYKARHIALDKAVAVKVLRQAIANDQTLGARLRLEAKAASRLDHPNSVRVIDFGEEPDGLLYIAMELLDGLDLFQTLERQWPIPDSRTIDLLCQTLSALAVAHDMGIVHRDLKPENIMLLSRVDDEGRPRDMVKVCDFGIAKTADSNLDTLHQGARALTTQGILIGTPEYMSPEQCRGQPLDPRSDLYSVGIILYQVLTGRVPFQAETAIDIVLKHISEEPVPPSLVRPGLSPQLERVCLRALRKLPGERYSSAREMRADLRSIVSVDSMPEASPAAAGVKLVASKTAETLLSVVSAPPAQVNAPIAADGLPRTKTDPEAAPKPRGRVRYAVMIAIPAAVVAAVAIRSQSSREPEASPSVAAMAAPPSVEKAPPETTPPSAVARNEVAALPRPAPSKASMNARPPALARPTPSRPAPSQAPAEPDPEPREPPPLPAATPALPANPTPTPVEAVLSPAPARPPTPPSTRVDPSQGRVLWNVSAASGGATAGNVAHALTRASSAWQRCYQASLEGRSSPVEGTATLRLTCDQQGRVVDVAFSGFDMGDVGSCIRAASKGVTIPNADTGEAWASVALTFKVAE